MKKFFIIFLFSFILIFFTANFALANDWTFTDTFKSYGLGDLNEQGGWAVTNYYGNPDNPVNVSTTDASEGTKYVEINNHGSLVVAHHITPITTGIFQVQMRHNKSGLFYFYALTSDVGGQLLFSIQFTESKGILLEEGSEQITLLPDYNANQWYLFTIDFDNTRGEHGTFKIRIDNGNYSEYEYVNSESGVFDFAQIVFGSEGSNGTAVSAFGDITPTPGIVELMVPEVAEENATTTSITSELSDGQTVTAPIDGVLVSGTTVEIGGTSDSIANDQLDMTASVIDAVISPSEDTNTNGTTTTEF